MYLIGSADEDDKYNDKTSHSKTGKVRHIYCSPSLSQPSDVSTFNFQLSTFNFLVKCRSYGVGWFRFTGVFLHTDAVKDAECCSFG